MDALFKMNRYGISSVAIVDENGNLFGNISLTDIKVNTMVISSMFWVRLSTLAYGPLADN